jgi:hypothetical protein
MQDANRVMLAQAIAAPAFIPVQQLQQFDIWHCVFKVSNANAHNVRVEAGRVKVEAFTPGDFLRSLGENETLEENARLQLKFRPADGPFGGEMPPLFPDVVEFVIHCTTKTGNKVHTKFRWAKDGDVETVSD